MSSTLADKFETRRWDAAIDEVQAESIDIGHAVQSSPYVEDSEAWHDARARGIGGSDAATILGLQPYGTDRVELWRQKTGREESKVGNAAVRYGSIIEPHVRRWLLERADDTAPIYGDFADLVDHPVQLHHPEYEWMRGHVDGVLVDGDVATAGVEIKQSTYAYQSSKYDWPGGIQQYHYPQIQHYLAVSGLDRWHYVYLEVPADREFTRLIDEEFSISSDDYWLWVVDQGEMTTEVVERDDDYIERLIDAEKRFWGHVEDDDSPDEWMPEGEVRVEDDELADLLDQYGRADARIKQTQAPEQAEFQKEEAKECIKQRAQSIAAGFDGEEPKKIWVNDNDYVLWHGSGYWVAKPDDRAPESTPKPSSGGDDGEVPDADDVDLGF